VARELRFDIEANASGARRGLDSAADGMDQLRREADRLEGEFKEASRAAEGLDKQLAETKVATAALAAEFAKTGDVGIKKQLDEQRKAARDLQRLRSEVVGNTERDAVRAAKAYETAFAKVRAEEQRASAAAEREASRRAAAMARTAERAAKDREKIRVKVDVDRRSGFFGLFGDAAKAGTKMGIESASTFSSAFQSGIMGAFKSLPAPAQAGIIAGLLAVVVAAAPLIASAISAAILLGIGSGGLAAGIALAVNNAQVKAAFAGLGSYVLAVLRDAAKPFQAELVSASRIFGAAFDRNAPQLRAIFASLSQAVQPLARGLSGLVTNAMPGIRRAAAAAVPMFKELAKIMPTLGKAISLFFSSIADAGPGAIATLKLILLAIAALIVELGIWLRMMGQIAAGFAYISDIMIPGARNTEEFGEAWAAAMASIESSTGDARREVQNFKVDLDALFGQQMDAREAAIAYEQAIDDLAEGFKRGSGALDIGTQKGRDNIRMINDTINAAREQLRLDVEAANGNKAAIDAANAKYQAQIERIRDVLRMMGVQESEIENLIGSASRIPRSVTIDIGLIGARAAMGMLGSLGNAIARVTGASGVGASASKQMKKRATGGPVIKGEAYIVGDGGKPEVFVPNQSGRILPDTSALMRHAAASTATSSRSGPLNLIYRGNATGLEALFLQWFMKKVRTGEVQLAT
jgi:hypothetical protein